MKMLNKSKLYAVILISVLLSNTGVVFAQDGSGSPSSDYTEDGPEPPPAAPIDEFIAVLFILGVSYAGRKIYLNQINSK